MSTTVNGTTGVTFPDGTNQNTSASGFGFKNRIINGAFMIDQRNAGASFNVTTSNQYVLDRWKFEKISNAAYTVQQVSDAPTGFSYSAKVTVTTGAAPTASSYNRIIQPIEGFNTSDLMFGTSSAQTVAVSFWVKSSIAGLYPVALQNGSTNRSYTTTFTINSANTWEYKTVTIQGDTTGTWVGATNGTGLLVLFDLGSDSAWNQTAGSWVAGNTWRTSGTVTLTATTNATFQITGVQLEKGSTATSFDYRPYGTELQLCKRYFDYVINNAISDVGLGRGDAYFYYNKNYPLLRATPSVTITGTPYVSNFSSNVSTINGVLATNYVVGNNLQITFTTTGSYSLGAYIINPSSCTITLNSEL